MEEDEGGDLCRGRKTVEAISISVMHVPTIKIHKNKNRDDVFFSFAFLYFFAIYPLPSVPPPLVYFSLYTFNHGLLHLF